MNNRELRTFLHDLLGEEIPAFLSWMEQNLPPVIRTHRLRISPERLQERLERQGFVLTPLPLGEGIFRVERWPFPLGNTLEHHLGYFYVQSLASLLPPLLLKPRPGERVLDLAAAPGSKTTQMSEMMENRGVIVANDIDRKRLRALANNVDRMGSLNVVITEGDGTRFGTTHPGYFHRVLLDAPCSALGTLHENREILRWWSFRKVRRLVGLQRKLILAAWDALAPGGVMVYSTCTLTPDENEEIVTHLLRSREGVEILPVPELPSIRFRPGLTRWKEGTYPEEMARTARIMPFENGTEGFFLALLRKAS